jgi:hypothetical protein
VTQAVTIAADPVSPTLVSNGVRLGTSHTGVSSLDLVNGGQPDPAIACFVTGTEARYGEEKSIPLRYCTDPHTGRTSPNVLTVLTR